MAAVNNFPPVMTDANPHRPGNPGPALTRAPAHAQARASSAARAASTDTRGATPASSTTAAASPAASTDARDPNRRTQSRAVVCGTPTRADTGRTPEPPTTTASRTTPMVSTTSSRPPSKNDGNNAWLTPHVAHCPRCTHRR